jgi:hypothetical protein
MKKALQFIILFLLPTALLLSQSLVDVSKKEQERREKLKGKNVKVITNADLKAIKRTPAVTTPAAPTAGAEAAEPPEQEYPNARAEERAYDAGGGSAFATAVLPDTAMVESPESALYSPDGMYAEISVMGFLELELNAKNGPGDDIAIYARWAGAQEGTPDADGEGMPISAWPYGMSSYGVLVSGDGGEWESIGRGTGKNRPEIFDLGSRTDIKKIRIIFKPDNNPSPLNKPFQLSEKEYTMGIDAVEALH